jgi:hypothetical protein
VCDHDLFAIACKTLHQVGQMEGHMGLASTRDQTARFAQGIVRFASVTLAKGIARCQF